MRKYKEIYNVDEYNIIDKAYNNFLINFEGKNIEDKNIGYLLYNLEVSSYDELILLINLIDYNRILGVNLACYERNPFTSGSRENSVKAIIEKIESNRICLNQYKYINVQILNGLNYLFSYMYTKLNKNINRKLELSYVKFEVQKYLELAYSIGNEIYKENGLFLEDKYNSERIYELMYYDLYGNSKFEFNEIYLEDNKKLNLEIKKEFGLDLKEIYLLMRNISDEEFISVSSLSFEKELFYEKFVKNIGVNKEEFYKFFDQMIYDIDFKRIKIKDWGLRKNHFTRQPIIKFEQFYLTCPGLIYMYLHTLIFDIRDRKTKNEEFNNRIHTILGEYDKEFELSVFNTLKNLTKFKIKHGLEFDWLSEIDILVIGNNNIYIIECKNWSLKVYPKELNNASKRASDIRNKMEKKINTIRENKKEISRIMCFDYEDIRKMDVKGIIVMSEMPIEFSCKDNKYIGYEVFSAVEFSEKLDSILC